MANSILLGNIRGQRGFSTKVQFSADAAAWHDNVETGDQYIRYSLTFDTDGNVTTWSNPSPLATTSVPVTTPAMSNYSVDRKYVPTMLPSKTRYLLLVCIC